MKKVLSAVLAMALCLALVACSGKEDAQKIERCKEIYEQLNVAHETVEHFGSDLYVMGDAMDKGFTLSRGELYHLRYILEHISIHLTEEEMSNGIEAAIEGHNLLDGTDADVALFVADCYDILGDLCLMGISNGYKLAGKVEAARNALYEASVMMTEIEGVDACAKHYLILQKYYEAIEEFLEICLNSEYNTTDRGSMLDSYRGYTQTYREDLDELFAG